MFLKNSESQAAWNLCGTRFTMDLRNRWPWLRGDDLTPVLVAGLLAYNYRRYACRATPQDSAGSWPALRSADSGCAVHQPGSVSQSGGRGCDGTDWDSSRAPAA